MVLLLACALPSLDPEDDLDNDGWSEFHGDCNDKRSAVNPEAIEECNGLDDDCDGTVDVAACLDYDPGEEDGASIIGESGLGDRLLSGYFDGDSLPDLVATARFGAATAVCVIGGARVTPAVNQALDGVANCWFSSPVTLPPIAVSATRFGTGLPAGQEVALIAAGTQVCAINPYARDYTLEMGAFACGDATNIPEFSGDFGFLLPADRAGGTVAATSDANLAVADPVDLLGGATTLSPILIEFPTRILAAENVGDVDGDGITDMAIGSGAEAWLVSGDVDTSAPVELLTDTHVVTPGSVAGTGPTGDLDGDGLNDWWASATEVTTVYRGDGESVTAVAPVYFTAEPAGDFNGDDVGDLWVRTTDRGGALMMALILGGDLPVVVDPVYDGDLLMFKTDGEFGAAFKSDFNLGRDAFADTWFAAPSLVFDEVTRGKLYLVEGWGLDYRYVDTTTDTAYPY